MTEVSAELLNSAEKLKLAQRAHETDMRISMDALRAVNQSKSLLGTNSSASQDKILDQKLMGSIDDDPNTTTDFGGQAAFSEIGKKGMKSQISQNLKRNIS